MKNKENLKITKKPSKFKKILVIVLISLIVGHIGMYIFQRNAWLYKDQPYPKAKEWLIFANFTLLYGNFLTKLPFIDEKSLILKPILKAQDYFVEKWKTNLPDNDAEKYLDWYIFRLKIFIMDTANNITLYSNGKYQIDEVKEFHEKAWQTIENLVKYEAKDKEFQEIRYVAFNNLSIIFVRNLITHWGYFDYQNKTFHLDKKVMLQDAKQHERLMKLYGYIKNMDNFYSTKYHQFFIKNNAEISAQYYRNLRLYELTQQILYWTISANMANTQNTEIFCNKDSNTYLKDFLQTKQWFLENKEWLKKQGIKNPAAENKISEAVENKIKSVCKNKNLKKQN